MPHSQYALRRQITAFAPTHTEDVGRLYLMVHEALDLLSKTWLQSPHWDHQPTEEYLAWEARWEAEAEEAAEQLKAVAGDIYEALTGSRIKTEAQNVSQSGSI